MVKKDRLYTNEHEWVKVEGNIATIGITDHAQEQLGDIVFVELPGVGTKVQKMKPCGSVESVKAVSELFSPISGEVYEINTQLEANPIWVNEDPNEKGWMLKIKDFDANDLNDLLKPEDYEKLLG